MAKRTLTGSLAVVPTVAVLAYLVAAPDLLPRSDINPYDSRRLLELAVLAVCCLSVVLSRDLRRNIAGMLNSGAPTVPAAGIALSALGVVSAVSATHQREAFLDVAILASLAVATVGCAGWARSHRERCRGWACAALLASVAISVTQFTASFVSAALSPVGVDGLFPGYVTPRFFSQWQTWTLPIVTLPALLMGRSLRILRPAAWLLAASWWTIGFLSGGRGVIVSLLVAAVFVAATAGGSGRSWLARQLPPVAFGALAALLLAAGFPAVLENATTLDRFVSATDSGRLELWQSALELFRSHPVLGVGPQHYAFFSGENVSHPHNIVLLFLAEWGLLATVLVGFLLWSGIRRLIALVSTLDARDDEAARHVGVALCASAIAAFVHANLSGLSIMPLSQMAACMVFAWLAAELSGREDRREGARATASTMTPFTVAIAAAVVAAALIVSAAPDVLDRVAEPSRSRPVDSLRYRPRIWLEGETNFSISLPSRPPRTTPARPAFPAGDPQSIEAHE